MNTSPGSGIHKMRIDHLSAIWIEPDSRAARGTLALWLPWFTGSKN